MQVVLDRGKRAVHDRGVEADDEQAQAAERQHERAVPAAEFVLAHPQQVCLPSVAGLQLTTRGIWPLDASRWRRTISVSCRRYTIRRPTRPTPRRATTTRGSAAVYHELTDWSRGTIMDKEALA